MDSSYKKDFINYLVRFISPQKWERMKEVACSRTRSVTVVLENLSQDFNVSAAMRTIECFGLQDVYLIEEAKSRSVKRSISKGSEQWLNVTSYKGPLECDLAEESLATKSCFDSLKAQGYKIIATTLHAQACSISEISVTDKVALVFGTETSGVSPYALNNADGYATIPMYGFTQSFNVAASVAISLYDLVERMRKFSPAWQLSEDEQIDLLYVWLKQAVRKSEILEEWYLKSLQNNLIIST